MENIAELGLAAQTIAIDLSGQASKNVCHRKRQNLHFCKIFRLNATFMYDLTRLTFAHARRYWHDGHLQLYESGTIIAIEKRLSGPPGRQFF
ncbi:MAG: hypothetical protein QNJ26_05175 [Desulfobacterales bacterium]|nr:hypothetical protein [Desulfobacterales bacterium]